jgi:hypothetical protein
LNTPRWATSVLALLALACSQQPPPAAPAPTAPAPPAPPPTGGPTSAEIRAEDLRLRVGVLAHDSMRGRESGTPEVREAADYIAREMLRLSLRPGGDAGTFFHAVPLERTRSTVEATLTFGTETQELTSNDLLLVSGFAGVPSSGRSEGEGAVVFTGYMFDPAHGGQELTAQQLSGAVAIVRLGAPPGVNEANVPPRMAVAALLSPNSPASAVLLVAEGELTEFWEYAGDVARKGSVALRRNDPLGAGPPIFLVAPERVELLLGASLASARQPKTGLGRIRYRVTVERESFSDQNIVAVLPGSDPARSDQYMTLGAHYDHVGVGAPVEGDSVYNGADDNASGTASLLEVAEHFASRPAAQRPARSLLFIWHAAEESGLLGSEHFTDRPTVDRAAMIGHINLDMVGRNGADSLFLIGSRRLSTEFGDWLEEENRRLPRAFILDYTLDAPNHPEMLYCRSDHWNFARFGIPSVMMGSGLHDDYHKPSDHVDKIDYEKVRRVVELAAALAERVANSPAAPRIDKPAPPLGTPCS